MNENESTSFIFYLTLEEHLPRHFYTFDRLLKELGFILIPVRVDQLQTLLASTDQSQIIVLSSISDTLEMKIYNEKVRGLLRFILKSKRITFMHLSSFSKLNDTKQFILAKNYYFIRYPLDARSLCTKMARYFDLKSQQNSKWPGGKRAGLGSVTT